MSTISILISTIIGFLTVYDCCAQLEIRHLMPARDRQVLCASRADSLIWYGCESGAIARHSMLSRALEYELVSGSQDIVGIASTSTCVIVQSRDGKIYRKRFVDASGWEQALEYGQHCIILGVYRDTVYTLHEGVGIFVHPRGEDGSLIETVQPRSVIQGLLCTNENQSVIYSLGAGGEVMRWQRGIGFDTLAILPTDSTKVIDRIVVIGDDSCIVGNWEESWIVTRDNALPFRPIGVHVSLSTDTLRSIVVTNSSVASGQLASFAAIATSTFGASRQSLLRLDKSSHEWLLLNNADSLLPGLHTIALNADTLVAFGSEGRAFYCIAPRTSINARLELNSSRRSNGGRWSSYIPVFQNGAVTLRGTIIDRDAQMLFSPQHTWYATHAVGSIAFSQQDSLPQACLHKPSEQVTKVDIANDLGSALVQRIPESGFLHVVKPANNSTLACLPASGILFHESYLGDTAFMVSTYSKILRFRYSGERWDTLASTSSFFHGIQQVGDTIIVAGTMRNSGVAFVMYSTNDGMSWISDTLSDNIAFHFSYVGTKVFISSVSTPKAPRVHVAYWKPGMASALPAIDSSRVVLSITPTKFFEYHGRLYFISDQDPAVVYAVDPESSGLKRIDLDTVSESTADNKMMHAELVDNDLLYFTSQRLYILDLDRATSVSEGESQPSIAVLMDAYNLHPNPTSGSLAFSLALAGGATSRETEVFVVDILGKVVANLTDQIEFANAGKQTVRISLPGEITSGLYYTIVRNGDAVRTLPMILRR